MATSRSCSGDGERRVHFRATFPDRVHYSDQRNSPRVAPNEADFPGLPGTYSACRRTRRVCGSALGPNAPPGAATPPPACGANGKVRPDNIRAGLFDSGVGLSGRRERRKVTKVAPGPARSRGSGGEQSVGHAEGSPAEYHANGTVGKPRFSGSREACPPLPFPLQVGAPWAGTPSPPDPPRYEKGRRFLRGAALS